jgi:hypothetical protein
VTARTIESGCQRFCFVNPLLGESASTVRKIDINPQGVISMENLILFISAIDSFGCARRITCLRCGLIVFVWKVIAVPERSGMARGERHAK